MATPTTLPADWAEQNLPIFRVYADQGSHPPVALNRPVCVIGRDYDANLPLESPQVSRHHALIVRSRAKVYLRDLASTNGIQRNGKRVRESELSDDDVLRVGAFTLRCASGFTAGAAPDVAKDSASPMVPTTPATLRIGDRVIPIRPPQRTFLIGRRKDCDLHVDFDGVSAVHAVLFEVNGTWYVRDLNTVGGTFVNGSAIHKIDLHPGDSIRIADTSIEFQQASAEHPSEKPSEKPPQEPAAAEEEGEAKIPVEADSAAPIPIAAEDLPEMLAPIEDVVAAPAPEPEPEPEQAPAPASQGEASAIDEMIESWSEQPGSAAPAAAPTSELQARLDDEKEKPEDEKIEIDASNFPPPDAPIAAESLGESLAEPAPEISAPESQPETKDEPSAAEEAEDDLIPIAQAPETPEILATPSETERARAERRAYPLDRNQDKTDKTDPDKSRTDSDEKITTLVYDIAEKATTLKDVWKEHQGEKEIAEPADQARDELD